MARFDRYLLSQLMVLFGFFSLVLVMVYWVNKAVGLFDQLIADGQSAKVFLEFTALTLPNVVRIILPISSFIATVYTVNRLARESELVVVQSTGFSAFRLARPVLAFGIIVALFMSLLTHFLVPASLGQMAEREAELSQDLGAGFFTEGRFLHPTDGLTIYIRETKTSGEFVDLFLSDQRNPAAPTVYTARRALLVRSDAGPRLLMYDGMAQTLTGEDRRLSITGFADFTYDISDLIQSSGAGPLPMAALSTAELLRADPARVETAGATRALFLAEAHERLTQPLLALVTALIGFSCLLLGGFNRFGVWRQIVLAVVLLVFVKAVDNAVIDRARGDENAWWLLYLPVVTGVLLAVILLWISEHPGLFRRHSRPKKSSEEVQVS